EPGVSDRKLLDEVEPLLPKDATAQTGKALAARGSWHVGGRMASRPTLLRLLRLSAWPGSHDFHMTRVAALRPRQRRLPQDARCGSPTSPGPGSRESYRRGASRRSRRLRE
ncbi:hypothetical protein ACWD6Z_30745, partial [Streptomyces californicus]